MTERYDGPERRRLRRPTLHDLWRDLVPLIALCLAGWSVLGVQARSEQVGQLAVANADRIRDVAALTRQIQDERGRSVIRNCRDVNERHDNTIRELDRLLARRVREAPTRAERLRLRASRQSTVLLIRALVPKRDCAALARQLVSTVP